jgi:hypothetical protein
MSIIGKHLLVILFSIIISYILATSADLEKIELGALANIFFPPAIGVFTICIYLVIGWLFKTKRNLIMIACVLINIGTGIFLLVADV